MKILHVSIASAFTEGMSYQDNLLTNQNVRDGHDVTLIADCNKFVDGRIVYTPPEDRILENGIHLIRVEYKKIINNFVSSKIRCVPRLYGMIEKIAPDVILFHGVAGWELKTMAKYKKHHPMVRLYIDSHEDLKNSGTNIISRIFIYRIFNRVLAKIVTPYTDKFLYVAYECVLFLKKFYNIPNNKMEYYPLGGIVFDDDERLEKRQRIRDELKLKEDDILLIHSGKMDKLKRSEEIIKAFHKVTDDKLHLILIGSIDNDVKPMLETLFRLDTRVQYLGWKSANVLMEYLCACDLYVQPGGQSATMQNALCCGCAVALYPHESHKYLLKDNAFYVETMDDMEALFSDILVHRNKLHELQMKDYAIAKEVLDYKILAKRLYQ